MSEYDVYLNGVGFMLAKRPGGGLVPAAAREQIVDPFTRHLGVDSPYTPAPFRFGDGAGLSTYDSSNRYEWGNCVDTRSGRLIPAPERLEAGEPYYQQVVDQDSVLVDFPLVSTGQVGLAERFTTPAGTTTIRSLAIMVKRHTAVDYSAASTFTVAIYSDTAGPKPNASLGSASISPKAESDPFFPFVDRWRNGQAFWLEVTFASDIVVGASTPFWIVVINNQTAPIYWEEDQAPGQVSTRSGWDGATWTNGGAAFPLMIKFGYKDGSTQFDSFPRCFQVYAGSDLIERMYCGTGYRVLNWDPTSGGSWGESKTVGTPVTQLLEFNEKLFAACGPSTDFWYSDGSAAGAGAWTQVSGQQSNAWAIYDQMLWKADGHVVGGSLTGLAGDWAATTVDVGDPGTPVTALTAHGGKLFAAKPEGIYEISYPDTYPASGTPTCNLMLPFTSERTPRTWLMDWHSGLYFPGPGGIYELKFDVLRNLWADKVDEGALETTPEGAAYTRPRSWAPLYDKGPATWASAYGTTRGAVFGRSNPHLGTSDVIWFDGSNWYSLRSTGTVHTDGSPFDYAEYCTAVFVQDAGGGRGWLWYSEGFGISRTEWPPWTEDTFDEGSVEYEQHSQATTPWFSLGEQTKKMLLYKIGVTSVNLTSTIHVDVSYRVDDETSWTALDTLDTSPYQELSFTAGTTCRRIQFLLALDVGSTGSNTPPIIEQVDLFYQTLTDLTKTHQLIVACGYNDSLREGGVDERTPAQILTDLEDLMEEAAFIFIDPYGRSHTVRATAVTGQAMDLVIGPGPAEVGVEAQAIVSLLEL